MRLTHLGIGKRGDALDMQRRGKRRDEQQRGRADGCPLVPSIRQFAMFSNNHHRDGHVGVWLPAPQDLEEALIDEAPWVYYQPPYVGSSGWIGIEPDQIGDQALDAHIRQAWQLIARK